MVERFVAFRGARGGGTYCRDHTNLVPRILGVVLAIIHAGIETFIQERGFRTLNRVSPFDANDFAFWVRGGGYSITAVHLLAM